MSGRIIVGVSGASGVIMAKFLLEALRKNSDKEIHLVVSDGAETTWKYECSTPIEVLYDLADVVYDNHDLAAAISSGSFKTDGMIILPCSMKTLAGIVSGYADDLLQRAADVCLKEGRKVVLVPREMPFGKVHLRNMKDAAELGCVIMPPVLTFYNGAETIEDQISCLIGKLLMQFDITMEGYRTWDQVRDEK